MSFSLSSHVNSIYGKTQGSGSVAIGRDVCIFDQGNTSVSIGSLCTKTQGTESVAIGNQASRLSTANGTISIGKQTGYFLQGDNSIAIGYEASLNNQGTESVSVGYQAGKSNQGISSVAIGNNAGITSQGSSSIAIGKQAGQNNQGTGAVAIGKQAGTISQSPNSIILNASNSVQQANVPGFIVNPVRETPADHGAGFRAVYYDSTINEFLRSDQDLPLGYKDWIEISKPTNPPTGKNRIYFKNDTTLYKLDDVGVERPISLFTAYGNIINVGQGTKYAQFMPLLNTLPSGGTKAPYIIPFDCTLISVIYTFISKKDINMNGSDQIDLTCGTLINNTEKTYIAYNPSLVTWTTANNDTYPQGIVNNLSLSLSAGDLFCCQSIETSSVGPSTADVACTITFRY